MCFHFLNYVVFLFPCLQNSELIICNFIKYLLQIPMIGSAQKKGRIVNQKTVTSRFTENEPSRLLRRYDTEEKFFQISYDRVSHLKQKYKKSPNKFGSIMKTEYQQHEPSRISNWTDQSQIQSCIEMREGINEFVKKVRGIYSEREGLKDISNTQSEAEQFAKRVKVIDSSINSKLNSLQLKIQELKKVNLNERTPKGHPTQKQQEPPRSICSQQNTNFSQPKSVYEEKVNQEQTGEFLRSLQKQIILDQQFNLKILSVPKPQLTRVKKVILQLYPHVNPDFLELSPMEIDPLQFPSSKELENDEQLIEEIYGGYIRMEKHFNEKLYKKHNSKTVRKFIEEFEEEVSLGHLITCINMKTGEEFRNRAVVKLLRRMGVESQKVKRDQFQRYFSK